MTHTDPWFEGSGLTPQQWDQLKLHQQKCLEALRCLEQLRTDTGMEYCLLAGSVLGPVRHGGFIPWDDDVDVGIPANKIAAFEQALLPRLPEGFTLVQAKAGYPYPRMFSKICWEGRCCIDLWPLVPTWKDGLRAKFIWYFGKLITKVHYLKIGRDPKRLKRIAQVMGLFMTDRMAMALARWNERQAARKDFDAYVNLYSIYRRDKETIPRQWIEEPATADFDGISVPVVGNTHAYLTHMYGDYMTPTPPGSRASRHVELFGNYD